MAVQRLTARVLPVNSGGAVLLLEERDPARPERRYWSTIGGAIEPGESAADAAAREAHEEAGIAVDPRALVGPVRRHQQAYSWGGVHYDGVHTYFALPLDTAVVVSLEHLEPEEVGNVFGARWWQADDLEHTARGAEYEPPALPDIMRAAVAAVEGAK